MHGRSLGRRFLRDDRGATAIEYALICGIIAVVVITIASTGGALDTVYQKLAQVGLALGSGSDGGGSDSPGG